MTKTKKLQAAIDLLKEEGQPCEQYCTGCFSCQIGRIIQDLESLRDIWYE